MPEIEIYDQIELPYALVLPAMERTLEAMAGNRAPYEKIALSVDFSGLHVPASGSVGVRVHLSGNPAVGDPASQFALTLEAESLGALFPKFEGFVSPNPLGATCTERLASGPLRSAARSPRQRLRRDRDERRGAPQSRGILAPPFRRRHRFDQTRTGYRGARALLYEITIAPSN